VIAVALGVKRVVTMSGLPGGHPGSTTANWVVNPWDSQYLDILDYQWNDVAIPFWKDVQARAAAADVKVAIEMHPHNIVFNPPTLQRLVEQTNATHVGAAPFLRALHDIDPDMAVNIEHEDTELDQVEGLRLAAENLITAGVRAGI
jgi:sugar phosphate isomerase/epimerase